jgi:two-component system chemotaxis sensor kinase CheA
MDPDFVHLLDDFVDEARRGCELVAQIVLALDRGERTAGAIEQLRRELHTIKGNAAMMDIGPLVVVAHAMEDVVTRGALGSELVDMLLYGSDLLASIVNDARAPERWRDDAAAFAARVAGDESTRWAKTTAPSAAADANVRIEFRAIEQLSDLVGEACALLSPASRGDADATATLGATLRAVRQRVAAMRLVPIRRLVARYERFVRDAARARGAPIALVVSGRDTLIDKALLDRLDEPLVHLVRNAIAHGIEPPDQRGTKPREARITIDARVSAGRVVVAVSDDGRGLQIAKLRARARDAGIAEDASDEEIARLVFRAGVSTATSVTDLAGRGVGLDAVAAAVRAMGGAVDVATREGQGASFTIALPMTTAAIRGLLVTVDGETLVVPFDAIVETTAISEAVQTISGVDVVSHRGGLLPVLDGGRVAATHASRDRAYCVVIATDGGPRGLLADELAGYGDVTVKAIDPALGASRAVGAAALLGDGRVAFVVDPRHVWSATVRAEDR